MISNSSSQANRWATLGSEWPDSVPPLTGRVISAATDIAMLVSSEGVIEHVSVSNTQFLDKPEPWVGRSLVDIVARDSVSKAQDLLKGACPVLGEPSREINHPTAAGTNLAVRYTAISNGADGAIILLGRDLRPIAMLQQRFLEAQQATEREYSRLRLAETRYRMMFQFASEPILVVDAATLKIAEANSAALLYFELPSDRMAATTLPLLFSKESTEPLRGMLHAARSSGKLETVEVLTTNGGRPIDLGAITFRQEGGTHFLVRLSQVSSDAIDPVSDKPARQVHSMVENAPDGCVIMDPERLILHANIAFLELAQLASKQQAIGQSLERWLGRPGIDLALIQATLADHRIVRNFPTIIRGEFGGVAEVELSAVTSWAGDAGTTGFIIRSKSAQSAIEAQSGVKRTRSVEQLAQLVGRVPLKDLVRETSDVIEQLCIETALDLSKDNRASAAQMLGLSRQSFYAKLRRYGLGDLGDIALENEYDPS